VEPHHSLDLSGGRVRDRSKHLTQLVCYTHMAFTAFTTPIFRPATVHQRVLQAWRRPALKGSGIPCSALTPTGP